MKAKEQELIESSSADALTGALNRRAAQERIEELLTHVRCGFLSCWMWMISRKSMTAGDIPRGCASGQPYGGIRKEFRQEDITGRIGGDEFVIFMPDTGDAAVYAEAESLLARLPALGRDVGQYQHRRVSNGREIPTRRFTKKRTPPCIRPKAGEAQIFFIHGSLCRRLNKAANLRAIFTKRQQQIQLEILRLRVFQLHMVHIVQMLLQHARTYAPDPSLSPANSLYFRSDLPR